MSAPTNETRLKILEYIVDRLDTHRAAPSREEIKTVVGLASRSSVQYHINGLVKDGFLENKRQLHRVIAPTEAGISAIKKLKELNG